MRHFYFLALNWAFTYPKQESMRDLKKMQTFIVDDDSFWVGILSQILEGIGFEKISSFDNGQDCLEHLNLEPALVFLDYQMVNFNGLAVLKELKKHRPDIEVVFCTGLEDLEVAMSAIENGSVDYFLKSNATAESIAEFIENFQATRTY